MKNVDDSTQEQQKRPRQGVKMVKSKFMKQFMKGELAANSASKQKEVYSDYINQQDDILSLQNKKYGQKERGFYLQSEDQDDQQHVQLSMTDGKNKTENFQKYVTLQSNSANQQSQHLLLSLNEYKDANSQLTMPQGQRREKLTGTSRNQSFVSHESK